MHTALLICLLLSLTGLQQFWIWTAAKEQYEICRCTPVSLATPLYYKCQSLQLAFKAISSNSRGNVFRRYLNNNSSTESTSLIVLMRPLLKILHTGGIWNILTLVIESQVNNAHATFPLHLQTLRPIRFPTRYANL